jgi:hypothetical protein
MIKVLKGIFYWMMLLYTVCFNACIKSREDTHFDYDTQEHKAVISFENKDQWFLDKYSDEYLASTLVNYPEVIRLVHPETKDKVRHIRIGHSREDIDYSKLLEFTNLETLQSHYSPIGLSSFSQFKNLNSLMVYGASIGEYNFSDLAGLTELEYIDFELEKGSVIDFLGIENLKKLEYIFIDGNYYNKERAIKENIEFKYYSEWKNIETTYKNIEYFSELTGLEYSYVLNKLMEVSDFRLK